MFAGTNHHVIRIIAKRSLPPTFARMSSRAAQAFHDSDNVQMSIEPSVLDPLGLDIVSSPEVRKILAQARNHTYSKTLSPVHGESLFQVKHTSVLPNPDWDDGYDSDFEPMHGDWESEDGYSIDEKRML
jgi:hypothetical protein